MSAQYRKIYANGDFVAYARADGTSDHLFLWKAASAPDAFNGLADLLTAWSAAERTVLFCQRFDPATLTATLDRLAASPTLPGCWGKLAYWRESRFTGMLPADNLLPDGRATLIGIGDVILGLNVGAIPQSLDDFTVAADASDNLTLALKASPDARWSIDGVSGESLLLLSLNPPPGFVAGSLGLSIPWRAPAARHPLNRVGFMFVGGPPTPPAPGGDPVPCRVWTSQLSDKVIATTGTGKSCLVVLDPRDSTAGTDWLAGEMNSSLFFGDAEIHSSFFSPAGDRFILNAAGGAVRLGFVFDRMLADQTLITLGDQTVFHPEGDFTIKPAREPTSEALNISSRDFVAGAASTEFFDIGSATHVQFVKRQPAFFLENESGSPTSRHLLDDRSGVAITSYVQFHDGRRVGSPSVPFHSQPAEAPLFVYQSSEDHLGRRRKPYGFFTSAPAAVFPRAGYHPGTKAENDAIDRFETTHLSQYRRNKAQASPRKVVTRQLVMSNAAEAADAAATLAVTPQGVLAEVDANDHYTRLYFGNPDSKMPRLDFSVRLCNSDPVLFSELQQALAASQLFLVLNKPAAETLNTISPSATLHARDFQFSVGPQDWDEAKPCAKVTQPMGASVVIIKYFKGKSLAELIEDPSYWACQKPLAPNGNAGIKELTGLGNKPVSDWLKDLEQKWNDSAWQGILVLDIPVLMPDLLEALRPGLSSDTPDLRAHHFGLNAVPAHSSDLAPGSTPQRSGSAFGLIQYERKRDTKPQPPKTIDKEPGATSETPRSYEFIVDSLHVSLANSQISAFQATVFVNFDHLFWDPVKADGGGLKSIELDGYYESRTQPDGTTQEVFSLISRTPMEVDFEGSSFLQKFTITRAQLSITNVDRNPETKKNQSLTAEIDLDGTLILNEKLTNLRLFTVKSIRLYSFGFAFTYVYADKSNGRPAEFSFGFNAPRIAADIDFNPDEVGSLLSFLPAKLKGVSVALGNLLDLGDLDFSPINFGTLGSVGTKFHFGFLLDLDLGSIGKLSGDLSGLHLPALLGWKGGSSPGLAFGIQFPTFNKKIDIGIQQFIRLQAKKLNIKRCLDSTQKLSAIAIQAVEVRVVFLGKPWPVENDIALLLFIPAGSNRKPSWALGFETADGIWYVGGGYRIALDGSAGNTKDVVKKFADQMNGIGDGADICNLLNGKIKTDPGNDNWSIAGRYKGEAFTVQVALSDPSVYGLDLSIPGSGLDLDLLYRRVNGQLGIFSIEFTLPGPMRTMQFGAATVRLPVLRLEVHTDGGFLADFGFPWNNDFSRSAQVEMAIFLGSGGFYFGLTAASASDLLHFAGGYGYLAHDAEASAKLNDIRALRLGFAARVGIGRSFTIGIFQAEASITIFGGLEGGAGYRREEKDFFKPTVWALKGYMGLMLDISAKVDFAIIQASARILAYADVGLQIRRVLVRKADPSDPRYYLVTLPVIVFADIGLTVGVDVGIHVGCVDITIHLSFSAVWHFEHTLVGIDEHPEPYDAPRTSLNHAEFALVEAAALNPLLDKGAVVWPPAYKQWASPRSVSIYVTVLPCMAQAADFGETGAAKSCVVGMMMLAVHPPAGAVNSGFGDLARFLTGWVLLPPSISNPSAYDDVSIALGQVIDMQELMKDQTFWKNFPAAVLTAVKNQFVPALTNLRKSDDQPFAAVPPWPGSSFSYVPAPATPVTGKAANVKEEGTTMPADNAAFVEYCRHLIVGTLSEIRLLLQNMPSDSRDDRAKSLKWAQIWLQLFGTISTRS